jgi:hypothetical protein
MAEPLADIVAEPVVVIVVVALVVMIAVAMALVVVVVVVVVDYYCLESFFSVREIETAETVVLDLCRRGSISSSSLSSLLLLMMIAPLHPDRWPAKTQGVLASMASTCCYRYDLYLR